MYKRTITYKDFNDVERTEDFYFNLTQAEALTIQLSAEGNNFQEQINRIAAEQNGKKIIEAFKQIICAAYGEKSVDGRSFHKTEEILERFTSTEAYSQLFVELALDAEKASVFVNGIAPQGLSETSQQVGNSHTARERSEAQMQGFKKPQERQPETVSTPVEIPAAQPVLDAPPVNVAGPSVPEPSHDEMLAAWRAQQGLSN